MKELNELINEAYEDAISCTLETIYDLQDYAQDMCMNVLVENGASLMESSFAATVLSNYINILNDTIAETFSNEQLNLEKMNYCQDLN